MNVLQSKNTPCRVTILVLPESSMMCVASVLEPMRAANRVADNVLYEWNLVSLTGDDVGLTCDIPLRVEEAFSSGMRGDLLILIAGFNQQRHIAGSALSDIRKCASGYDVVAGVEAGSWVLARTGLLNGHSATTHWEDFEAFSDQFPDVDLKLDRYVVDGNRMTCGGASPAFDMMLDYIRKRNGPAVAMEAASVFIYDEAHSQFDEQPLISLGRLAKKEGRLAQAVRLMGKRIEEPLPVAAIARRIGVSSNTLETIFKRNLGMTPGKFYLSLRLKSANRLVRDTDLSLREIAIRNGFNSLSAFSRAYVKEFGKSARQLRGNLN